MERDWARLGGMVKAARLAGGMTQNDLAQVVDVGLSTIQGLERGARTQPKILPVHRAVARVLGWTEASVEAVLAGGEPTLAAAGPSATPGSVSTAGKSGNVDDLLDDLTERVREALLGGKVADATALAVDPEDEGGVVLIWKRGEKRDLTPDERRDLERKWTKLQRAAHEIFAEDDPK